MTVATAATVGTTAEVNSIFNVTGRTTDTLTGVTAIEGTTDRNYAIGDRVECRWTSGLATAIETAVNGVENSTGITSGVIAPARLGSGTGSPVNWLRGDGTWSSHLIAAVKNSNSTIATTLSYCDATSGALTLTLPSANTASGLEFVFYRADASTNVITINRAGTDYFQSTGGSSITLSVGKGKYVRIVAAGTEWLIIGSN